MNPESWDDRVKRGMRGLGEQPAPTTFLHYELREKLGEGAAAEVFRAVDRKLGREVALKFLRDTFGSDDRTRKRFLREAQASARLSHPNVVAVHDAGEADGKLYLVLELVDGRPLSLALEHGNLPLRSKIDLLEKTARGVAAAHAAGIIHRDLKPGNILVTRAGEPKVSDFGLAHLAGTETRLTRTGAAVGTPLYMAPEQVTGRPESIGPRTDVYALGALLYEVLTGRPPHLALNVIEVYAAIIAKDPDAPRSIDARVPPELDAVCLKALEKEPSRRYSSSAAFGDELSRWLRGEPVAAKRTSRAYRIYRRIRRNLVVAALGALAGVAILVAGVAWAAGGAKARRYEEERRTEHAKLERERAASLDMVRSTARISLEAALQFRRAGLNAGMKKFLPELEDAYRQAVERAPDLAEVDYLMGRLHRALMEDVKALEFQERALKKDSAFRPAIYERVLLLTKLRASRVDSLIAGAWRKAGLRIGDSGEGGQRTIASVEELVRQDEAASTLGRRIEEDCAALDRPPQLLGSGERKCASGMSAIVRGDTARAILEFQEAVREDPMLADAYEALACVMRSAGRHEDVIRWCREGLENDRGYVPLLLMLGRAFGELSSAKSDRGEDATSEFSAAVEALERATSLDPGQSDSWHRLGSVHTNWAMYSERRGEGAGDHYARAVAAATRAVELDASRAEYWMGRGVAYLNQASPFRVPSSPERAMESLDRALSDLRESTSRDKLDPMAWHWKGTAHMNRAIQLSRQGGDPLPDLEQADSDLSQAVTLNPSRSDIWFSRGQLYSNWSHMRPADGHELLRKAIRDFDEAIRIDPRSSHGWIGRADARYRVAELEQLAGEAGVPILRQVLADVEKGLGLNRMMAAGWKTRALALRRMMQGRSFSFEEAVPLFRAIVESAETAIRLEPGMRENLGPMLAEIRPHLERLENRRDPRGE